MGKFLRPEYRPYFVVGALALALFGGWIGFAYSVVSSRSEISQTRAERDAVSSEYDQLKKSVGDLSNLQARLSSARSEYNAVIQAWADARSRLGAMQQEVAVLTKRLEQAGDRVSQTGSVRPGPPQPAARKPDLTPGKVPAAVGASR